MLTYASAKGLSLLSTLVLAHLLLPADFGVVALAGTVVVLLSLIQDLGIANTLILRPDVDRRTQGTVLTLMLITGTGLALLGAVCAPLLATVFREPRLDGIFAVLMINVATAGIWSFHQTLLQRELEFRKRFIANLVTGVLYAMTSIALAVLGAGVWSMVVGQLVATTSGTVVMVAYAAPYRVAPRWDRKLAAQTLREGRGFLAQSGLYFVQQNADYLIIGRLLQARQLGFYFAAFRLAEVPVLAIAEPVAAVTFPAFSAMRAKGEDVRPAFLSVLRLTALVTCPIAVLLSATAGPLTEFVLGDRWLAIIPVLSVLGIWATVRPLLSAVAWLLNSVGAAGLVGCVSGALMLPLIAGIIAAADMGDIVTVAWVVLAHTVLFTAWLAWIAGSRAQLSLRRQWHAVRPVAGGCAVAWAVAYGVVWSSVGPPVITALLAISLGLGAYLLTVHRLERGILRDGYRQIARTLAAPARADAAVEPNHA